MYEVKLNPCIKLKQTPLNRKAFKQLVDNIYTTITEPLPPLKKQALEIIILNFVKYKDLDLIARHSHRSKKFTKSSVYNTSGIGLTNFIATYQILHKAGWITIHKAKQGSNVKKASVIKATPYLRSLLQITLDNISIETVDTRPLVELRRNIKGEYKTSLMRHLKIREELEYKPNKYTREDTKFLREYLTFMSHFEITMHEGFIKAKDKDGNTISGERLETAKSIYGAKQGLESMFRAYIAPEDYKEGGKFPLKGGRFYGGWWQEIPNECRGYIHIDGEEAGEVDFKAMNPNMLYVKETDQLCREYAYDNITVEGSNGTVTVPVKLAKNALLMGMNCRTMASVRSAISSWVHAKKKGIYLRPHMRNFMNENEVTPTMVYESTVAKHRTIAKYLPEKGKDIKQMIGLDLQYWDSEITKRILSECMRNGILCLPIHDSYMVKLSDIPVLKKIMKTSFEHKFDLRKGSLDIDKLLEKERIGNILQQL